MKLQHFAHVPPRFLPPSLSPFPLFILSHSHCTGSRPYDVRRTLQTFSQASSPTTIPSRIPAAPPLTTRSMTSRAPPLRIRATPRTHSPITPNAPSTLYSPTTGPSSPRRPWLVRSNASTLPRRSRMDCSGAQGWPRIRSIRPTSRAPASPRPIRANSRATLSISPISRGPRPWVGRGSVRLTAAPRLTLARCRTATFAGSPRTRCSRSTITIRTQSGRKERRWVGRKPGWQGVPGDGSGRIICRTKFRAGCTVYGGSRPRRRGGLTPWASSTRFGDDDVDRRW